MATTTRTRTATTAKTATPAEVKAAAVTVPEAKGGADLFASLANGAKTVAELPKTVRGSSRKPNPLTELVLRSYTEGQAFELPPVADDDKLVAGVKSALRRAAASSKLGVTIRDEVRDGQVVISFRGRDKAAR